MVPEGNRRPTFTEMKLPLRCVGRAVSMRLAGAVLLAVALALLAGGCATTHEFTVLKDPAEVNQFLQASNQPVLLMFSKQG